MKRFHYFPLIFVILMAACKKNNNSSKSAIGISAWANGKFLTFNTDLNAGVPGRSGIVYFSGYSDSPAVNTLISFIITSNDGIINPGIYPSYSISQTAPHTSMLEFYSGLEYPGFISWSNDDSVTITSISSDSTLQGTFHGTVIETVISPGAPGGHRDSVVTLTNGQFNIKY
ncbi:MAG TPA: hypothetical protein VGZ90_17695 [Puia sp.]|jgi:hypothetical protein|nr:hypothetical protein [Puia sp.]